MTTTLLSTRFGDLEIPDEHVLELPDGLIGLPGRRYAVLAFDEGPFRWLQSMDDPSFALPVCDPRTFFADFRMELDPYDHERIGLDADNEVIVWTTVRPTPEGDWCTNLRAPIVVVDGRGWQLINHAGEAPLRASLGLGPSAD